jgi:molybdate transport system substrate-binding protein
MRRFSFKLLIILVFGVILLTGCKVTKNEYDNKTPSSNETNTSETATSDSSTAESSNIITLEEAEIYVFIATSLNNVMTKVQEMYNEANPNITIIINAESSGTLQTQIEEGAECDLFFSAAMKQMNALNDGGYIESDSIKKLLENKVVLIKPTEVVTDVTGFENIFNASNIALAGEDVPVGAYAREIFIHLGIWDKVSALEINQGANVTSVLAAVSEASNKVGVVYATDANSVKGSVEVIAEAPEGSLATPVLYPAGLVINPEADDAQTIAAKDFLEFLSTDPVLAVFEEYGFSSYNK